MHMLKVPRELLLMTTDSIACNGPTSDHLLYITRTVLLYTSWNCLRGELWRAGNQRM